jgi:hypothetical protein
MATKVNINGRIVTRPGVYTTIKSGVKNPAQRADYGVVAIIDDGIGANWGGGQGKVVYEFTSPEDFKAFIKGGPLFDLANPLFNPVPTKRLPGASKVMLIQAKDTTPATITLTFTNGSIVLTTKDEGVGANGVAVSSVLKQGYAARIVAGKTSGTYKMQILHGTFTGIDSLNNTPYDGVAQADAAPVVITESPEVATITLLGAWLANDPLVVAGFQPAVVTITTPGTDGIVVGDIAQALATGATETYSNNAFTAALTKASSYQANAFLATRVGSAADHANNLSIRDTILTGKYDRFLWIGGGTTASELDSISLPKALVYNSDKVIIVHGDGLLTTRTGFKTKSVLWKTANVLGRLCGLAPQTPLTLKSIGLDSEALASQLDSSAQERALAGGVLVTYFDDELGYEVVLQGVNTLQNNAYLVNEDGTSFSISVKRICAQLNKEVAIYLKRKFFGKDMVGPNRNTITEADLVAATEGYLTKRVANTNSDDYITGYGNITASISQDNYSVNYEFYPNFEVNKMIVTGIIIDKSGN